VRHLKIIAAVLLCGALLSCGCGCAAAGKRPAKSAPVPGPVYGVTLSDPLADNLDEIVQALSRLPVKPTARVVLNRAHPARDYLPALKRIHRVAYVLLCPCDSTEMKDYPTVKAYRARFRDCADTLSACTDIWEIGNEVNGEGWLGGTAETVSARIQAAYREIKGRGLCTELTPYQFRPGDQSMSMEDWLRRYLPAKMRNGLDYVMVSYYDADNGGEHEDWKKMFASLARLFPRAKLGFGECGFPDPCGDAAAFTAQLNRYYRLPKLAARYVGGYFWWYWQEDCVPSEHNARWTSFRDGCAWMKQNWK
jgi:hypothetical protein